MDSYISYIHDGARVNVWCETKFWVIMGDSKMDTNKWEVVVNSEWHETRSGCTIVTIYLSENNK